MRSHGNINYAEEQIESCLSSISDIIALEYYLTGHARPADLKFEFENVDYHELTTVIETVIPEYFKPLKKTSKAVLLIRNRDNLTRINLRKLWMFVQYKQCPYKKMCTPAECKGWSRILVTLPAGSKCYRYENEFCVIFFTKQGIRKRIRRPF